jgi:hypothetical protein
MTARLFAFLLLLLPASVVAGEVELLMFEEPGCVWCARWNAEISDIYPKTQEGRAAPLHRIQIRDGVPEGMQLTSRPAFTPTFVVIKDNVEVGRIEGYPGADFFWGLLGRILQPLPEFKAAKGAS